MQDVLQLLIFSSYHIWNKKRRVAAIKKHKKDGG